MGIKKQAQLIFSLSKVVFNSDILVNGNLLNLLPDNFWDNIIPDKLFEEK